MTTGTGQEWIAESVCGVHRRMPTLGTAPVQLITHSKKLASFVLTDCEESSSLS
ncbi:hypothetical protein BT69DRAFT_1285325 [Atractiella rhizophila]|nr:hypothetical protein BT69DRAFT_1285325 [Atractiella rhizophila]